MGFWEEGRGRGICIPALGFGGHLLQWLHLWSCLLSETLKQVLQEHDKRQAQILQLGDILTFKTVPLMMHHPSGFPSYSW